MQLTRISLKAARGLALTMMFTLAACIDLKQSIEISDGLVSYEMEMRMNSALAQLDVENIAEFCDSHDEMRVEVSGELKRTIRSITGCTSTGFWPWRSPGYSRSSPPSPAFQPSLR